ncbi:LytTR family DNA-binding domain-containing protein [Paraflavitalea sp. CAU 1676]|uniref:LytR/AlgR family response regulator transcription factor n=1 Tax=Paraflavitalea sp. CAU 1676 TaxID=3032598 RepID=UPI0023DA6C36|nr:LytTR family DNA-binding domain-containing protein [Paraflavitalea sp. CAU 1676]MDF2188970.1 LytTR family DNA-binding domain-containing protein [Paraflavitalea sp. CAU 1676]
MIRCLAVDDELLSLELLEDNIRRIPFLQLVGRCFNAYEALEIMRREPVDLIFLDIQMGGITGTQFLQSISTMPARPLVIFVTAYKNYALEGFDLDVLDYLVKPVAFERFLKAVNKAADYLTPAPVNSAPEYFFVNVEYNLVRIEVNAINFVEGLKDYIKIYLQGSDKAVITRLPMKSIAEKLPANRFVRIHKSYIISVDKITSIRKNRIYIHQHIIPISDSYRDDLFRIIDPQKLI